MKETQMQSAEIYKDNYYYYCYMRWRMPPFKRQCWGLQVGPMHDITSLNISNICTNSIFAISFTQQDW